MTLSSRICGTTLALFGIVISTGHTQDISSEQSLEIIPVEEILNELEAAPVRKGPPPDVPPTIPHQQPTQNAPVAMQEKLLALVSGQPGVFIEPTGFSLPGSLGWRLEEGFANGPDGAFIRGSLEYGHQHRPTDGSMHLLQPVEASRIVQRKGWGIVHPFSAGISGRSSDYLMIFGPRDEAELETIWIIAQISYYQARGLRLGP